MPEGADDSGFDDNSGFGDGGFDDGGDGDEILRLLAPLLAPLMSGQTPPAFGQPFAVAPNATPDQAIQSLLSLVAPQLRGRLGGLLTGVNALQGQANASPMALLGAGGPQLTQLLQRYLQGMQGLSRSRGPFGGGFLTQGRRQLGGQFANSLAQLFAGIPGQAQGMLGKIAEGTSIAFPVPRTNIGTGTQTQPGGFSVPTATNIQGIGEALKGIFGLFGSSSPSLLSGGGFENLG